MKHLWVLIGLACLVQFCSGWSLWAAAASDDEELQAEDDWMYAEEEGFMSLSVLLVPAPFSTIFSAIALGEELGNRAHAVRIASLASERERVESAAIDFLELGPALNKTQLEETFEFISAEHGSRKANRRVLSLFLDLSNRLADGLEARYPLPASGNASDIDDITAEYPDVIVFSTLALGRLLDFARKRGIPAVISLPTVAIPPFLSRMPYVPVMGSGLPLHGKSLTQRISNLARRFIAEIGVRLSRDELMSMLAAMASQQNLFLVGSFPGFDYPAHMSPLVQYTGPLISPKRAEYGQLDHELLQFIENDDSPIVYVSFGTVVRLQPSQVAFLAEALNPGPIKKSERAWRIVWALPEAQQKGLPDFVRKQTDDFYIANWIETPAILSHVAAKGFVSHCGGNGVHESIALGVPIVGIPFFGDQPENCFRIRDSGAGVCLPGSLIGHPKEEVTNAVRMVVGDDKIRSNVATLRRLMDRYKGSERAADWVEFVAETNGDLSLLETPAERDGFFKAFDFDIFLACDAMFGLAGLALGWMLKVIWDRKCRAAAAREKED